MHIRKIAVIGVGHVGAHVASHIVISGACEHLILIDIDEKKVSSHCQDLCDSAAFSSHRMVVECGDYSELDDADMVVISASGPIFKENRLEELDDNIEVVSSIIRQLKTTRFSGIVISITNPCDVIAQFIARETDYNVIGTGTLLDSARLRSALARELGIAPKNIQAYCLGEHGDSQVIASSTISVMGKPLDQFISDHPHIYPAINFDRIEHEVIGAGWHIVLGKGATEFGIGSATGELIRAISHDDKCVLPCSTLLTGQYGEHDVYASVPCIIGRNGVELIIELPINAKEREAFSASCSIIRNFLPKMV